MRRARLFRRRPLDPEVRGIRRAFETVALRVEGAQRALLAAVPTARAAGIPLAQALAAFERGLREADERMPSWRHPASERWWSACADGVRAARAQAERLRLEPGEPSFEALNERIGDLLAPLEVFADTASALRRLRREPGRREPGPSR